MDWLELFWMLIAWIGWMLVVDLHHRLHITQAALDELARYILFKEKVDKEQ